MRLKLGFIHSSKAHGHWIDCSRKIDNNIRFNMKTVNQNIKPYQYNGAAGGRMSNNTARRARTRMVHNWPASVCYRSRVEGYRAFCMGSKRVVRTTRAIAAIEERLFLVEHHKTTDGCSLEDEQDEKKLSLAALVFWLFLYVCARAGAL